MSTQQVNPAGGGAARVLVVADWSVDPRVVARGLLARHERDPVVFRLLVPSRLPGLDWIGDPTASRPCAERQLRELERMARALGLNVAAAEVGDPERVAAIRASLDAWPADRVLLFERRRRVASHPLDVARRVERRTGQRVQRIAVPAKPSTRRRFARSATRCRPAAAIAS